MRTQTRVNRFTVVATLAVLLPPLSARADECVRIDTTPKFSTLSLRGDNISTTEAPGLYCTLEPDRTYRLSVSYPNHETRYLKLGFKRLGEPPRLSGVRLSHLARSVILPGWGQADLGYKPRAVMAFSSVAFAAVKFSQSYRHYKNERDLHDYYLTLIDGGNTDAETARRADQSAENLDAQEEHMIATAAAGGYLYLWNLVESVLLATPPGKRTTGEGAVVLEIPQRSKARAAIRSMFFPGLGQKYYGSESRGVLYQILFMTGVYGTLDAKVRYDLRDITYRSDLDYAEANPGDVDAQELAKISRESLDDARQRLKIWGAATAGMWALAVIDAIARGDSGGSRVKPGRLEMTSGYQGGVMRTGLSVRF